jgi:hypothetical protein
VLGSREGHWTSMDELCQCMRASMLLPGTAASCNGPPSSSVSSTARGAPMHARAARLGSSDACGGLRRPAAPPLSVGHLPAAGIAGPVIRLPSMTGSMGETEEEEGGEPLADAMLFEPIPYRAALAEGATHVLVLRTRPDGLNLVRKQAVIEKLIAHRFFRRKEGLPRMAEHMAQQQHRRGRAHAGPLSAPLGPPTPALRRPSRAAPRGQ